ncbi:hypothetical protein DPMN_061034 [Dreissena polymorpha]|uniref:Uncharacterized protein n=1 Tax=Dreissena polymorpha TaxID=45954 RepID=A0A9D4HI14_DREPO|nr:hypothetical protein DPMN_061034 [Dreissena polymorpha]
MSELTTAEESLQRTDLKSRVRELKTYVCTNLQRPVRKFTMHVRELTTHGCRSSQRTALGIREFTTHVRELTMHVRELTTDGFRKLTTHGCSRLQADFGS